LKGQVGAIMMQLSEQNVQQVDSFGSQSKDNNRAATNTADNVGDWISPRMVSD
jgi:hypothetical protein